MHAPDERRLRSLEQRLREIARQVRSHLDGTTERVLRHRGGVRGDLGRDTVDHTAAIHGQPDAAEQRDPSAPPSSAAVSEMPAAAPARAVAPTR